jgi:hypothetical protein
MITLKISQENYRRDIHVAKLEILELIEVKTKAGLFTPLEIIAKLRSEIMEEINKKAEVNE